MVVSIDRVEEIIRIILNTRDHEIGCSDCFAVLDQFLELRLQGKKTREIMPLVEEHLERCKDCHEEFDALVKALESSRWR